MEAASVSRWKARAGAPPAPARGEGSILGAGDLPFPVLLRILERLEEGDRALARVRGAGPHRSWESARAALPYIFSLCSEAKFRERLERTPGTSMRPSTSSCKRRPGDRCDEDTRRELVHASEIGNRRLSAMMKQGVVYDKKLGFKLDSATDMELAVRTISSALGEEVELTVRCFICTPGGTLILGDNKEIHDYKEGEQSVGVSGLCNIKEAISRSYEGSLVRVRATGMLPLELTPEHPVLVSRSTTHRHRTGKNRVQTLAFSKLHWKEAGAVTCKKEGVEGDYLLIPRIPGSITDDSLSLQDFTNANGRRVCAAKHVRLQIPLNQDTAWLLGMYIAEGFPSSTCACFSLNHDEMEIHQRIIKIGKSIGYTPKKYRRELQL